MAGYDVNEQLQVIANLRTANEDLRAIADQYLDRIKDMLKLAEQPIYFVGQHDNLVALTQRINDIMKLGSQPIGSVKFDDPKYFFLPDLPASSSSSAPGGGFEAPQPDPEATITMPSVEPAAAPSVEPAIEPAAVPSVEPAATAAPRR